MQSNPRMSVGASYTKSATVWRGWKVLVIRGVPLYLIVSPHMNYALVEYAVEIFFSGDVVQHGHLNRSCRCDSLRSTSLYEPHKGMPFS